VIKLVSNRTPGIAKAAGERLMLLLPDRSDEWRLRRATAAGHMTVRFGDPLTKSAPKT
jgi:hypothetical protein